MVLFSVSTFQARDIPVVVKRREWNSEAFCHEKWGITDISRLCLRKCSWDTRAMEMGENRVSRLGYL